MVQMQQTIVRGCVHIVYDVKLNICWELCMVCHIWASLNYIYKSTNWQASLLHSEQKKWVER